MIGPLLKFLSKSIPFSRAYRIELTHARIYVKSKSSARSNDVCYRPFGSPDIFNRAAGCFWFNRGILITIEF